MLQMARFNKLTPDNDPYGEHDCFTFELCSRRFLLKVDYYDLKLEHGSEDPAAPEKTMRILTLMLAEDY